MAVINGTINIDWFGDQKKYEKSPIKIITVGLNPSGIEFSVDKIHKTPNVSLRFGHIPAHQIPKYPSTGNFPNAWNNYFNFKPYKWFGQGFEHVLRGLNASYGGTLLQNGEEVSCTAIHTDLCTPWATDPTWSQESSKVKIALTKNYTFPDWVNLVVAIKPDIIIACIPQKYRKALMGDEPLTEIIRVVETKDGEDREPVKILAGKYKGALIIFGMTKQVPFGNVSTIQKKLIGENIRRYYDLWKDNKNFSLVKIGKDSIVE